MERLAPAARHDLLEAVAEPHGGEAPPARRVGFAHEQHAAAIQARGQLREQRVLLVDRQELQHIEQEHGVRRLERQIARVGFDDGGVGVERRSRHLRDLAPQLDARHAIEAWRRRPLRRPRAAVERNPRFRQQREREPLPAADVEERAAARQHIGRQRRAVDRIHAQLAARELPRGHARPDVAIRCTPHQLQKRAILVRAVHEAVGPQRRQTGERGPDEHAADQRVDAEHAEPRGRDVFARDRMKRSAPHPRAHLYFGEHEPRRDEWIRDVRGEVHLQTVEAEQKPDDPADRQMKAVERQAPDEDTERDGRRFTARPGALGAENLEESTKLDRPRGHWGSKNAAIIYDRARGTCPTLRCACCKRLESSSIPRHISFRGRRSGSKTPWARQHCSAKRSAASPSSPPIRSPSSRRSLRARAG